MCFYYTTRNISLFTVFSSKRKHCLFSDFTIQQKTFPLFCFYLTTRNISSFSDFTIQHETFPLFLILLFTTRNISSFSVFIIQQETFPRFLFFYTTRNIYSFSMCFVYRKNKLFSLLLCLPCRKERGSCIFTGWLVLAPQSSPEIRPDIRINKRNHSCIFNYTAELKRILVSYSAL